MVAYRYLFGGARPPLRGRGVRLGRKFRLVPPAQLIGKPDSINLAQRRGNTDSISRSRKNTDSIRKAR